MYIPNNNQCMYVAFSASAWQKLVLNIQPHCGLIFLFTIHEFMGRLVGGVMSRS